MWTLLGLFALIHMVTSRTEPMDFTKSGRLGFKFFPQRLPEIDVDDTNDMSKWNTISGRYNPETLNLDKSLPFNSIDSALFDQLEEAPPEDFEEVELNRLSGYLLSLLHQPVWNAPLIIMEDPSISDDFPENSLDLRPMWKRSSYSRRHPWKRLNSRSRNTYDYDSQHICTPSREDVYQLLVALHDVRQGNKSRTVNYCNRKRPVKTVFTNIRFLGRRK